jgi:putative ABC transport system ATP-binding protein
MIEIKDLVKIYSNKFVTTQVLNGIDLQIKDGEFLSIIGPSGAGKSTLLYQISLLDKPTAGQILVDGQVVTDLNEEKATEFRLNNYGFIFQDYALVPEMTVLENVILPSMMQGLPREEITKIGKEILITLGMEKNMDKLPSQLSGGEQQRVSIARAIAKKPRILFADEPTANLDTARSREVIAILHELHKQGQTIVMVTHEPEFAQSADRIVEIRDGKIVNDRKGEGKFTE